MTVSETFPLYITVLHSYLFQLVSPNMHWRYDISMASNLWNSEPKNCLDM